MRRCGIPLLGLLALLAGPLPLYAGGPWSLHVGADVRKMTREACARKAVEALAKEKFPFAVIDKEGNAWGHTDRAAVAVLSFLCPDGLQILVLAVSSDNAEAGRLRDAVRAHVFDGPYNPSAPRRIGKKGRSSRGPVLCWSIDSRPMIGPLRFFEAVTSVVLEKRGYQVMPGTKDLVFGGKRDLALTVFSVPAANAFARHLGVIAVSDTEEEGRQASRALLSEVLKVLYE
jgi:hypothetical protein